MLKNVLVGTFTAQVGDASDKTEGRPRLREQQVMEAARTRCARITGLLTNKARARAPCGAAPGFYTPLPASASMAVDIAHQIAVFKRGADELLVERELADKLARGQPLRALFQCSRRADR